MRFNRGSLLKVIAFVTVTGLMVTVVGITFARIRLEKSRTYHAIVANASGLKPGSDVRGAGVSIGSVKSVQLDGSQGVEVTFTAETHVPLTTGTEARIRYANLTGDRYLDLTPGRGGTPLADGATIPRSHTLPALELDDFFAGFDPLMRGLDPNQVNELAQNLLDVTQGQVGSVRAMLANIASFTNGLADHDQLVGQTIASLSRALSVIDGKRSQFNRLIVGMAGLLRGLAKDRWSIGSSIAGISRTAADVTSLLDKVRPGFGADLSAIGKFSHNALKNKAMMDDILSHVAAAAHKGGRLGPYGSFFDFYLCSVQVRIVTSTHPDPRDTTSGIFSPMFRASDQRCKFPEDR